MSYEIYSEPVNSEFEGTIIDLETIGVFLDGYGDNDSRRYKGHLITTFGFITKDKLEIHYGKNPDQITPLVKQLPKLLDSLPRPFAAFNASFEMSVLFHNTGIVYPFERELQAVPSLPGKHEAKWLAVKTLNLPQYDDPFNDQGKHCITAWHNGEIQKIISHNRADLLKERDILIRRGFRKTAEINFFK